VADGVVEGAGCFGELGLWAVVIVVVGAVLFFAAPPLAALLVGLGELVLVLVAAIGVLVWRTLRRSAWSVVARSETEQYRWRVVGYRRARRLVRAASESIRAGSGVLGVSPELTGGQGPVID
jgi:hypothetical protein